VARAVASEPAAPQAPQAPQVPQAPQAPQAGDDPAGVDGSAGHPVAREADQTATAEQKAADQTVPAEDEKKTASGLANVISLAQRIRALQRNGS
jgi:hypothetical protein